MVCCKNISIVVCLDGKPSHGLNACVRATVSLYVDWDLDLLWRGIWKNLVTTIQDLGVGLAILAHCRTEVFSMGIRVVALFLLRGLILT